MAYSSSVRRQPFNPETPEQKARDVLRGQKTIAGVTTRANQQAQSVAALQALAKATGVPMNVLPPGGIHAQMSPADVQAATDRINQWRSTQPRQAPGTPPPATTNINGVPFLNSPVAPPTGHSVSGSAAPVPPQPGNTRQTPTGGTETLVQSESGPRWVASVNNAPAANNQAGQVVSTGPSWAQSAPAVGKPWQSDAATTTTSQQATQIAQQYGDKSGGILTAKQFGIPFKIEGSQINYTGAPTPSGASRQQLPDRTQPITPIPPAAPVVPPTGQLPIAGTNPNPPGPANPITSPSRASGITQPFNPDEDDEQRKKRLAGGMASTPVPTPQPYQF